eukprot:3342961-Pleurochrysis_carterae.AAC.3
MHKPHGGVSPPCCYPFLDSPSQGGKRLDCELLNGAQPVLPALHPRYLDQLRVDYRKIRTTPCLVLWRLRQTCSVRTHSDRMSDKLIWRTPRCSRSDPFATRLVPFTLILRRAKSLRPS